MNKLGWTLGALLLVATIPAAALAGSELVSFPTNYKDEFTHYSSRDRDNPEQIAELYANDVALESAKDGPPLDHGSVLVMEIYKAKLDENGEPVIGEGGRRIKDALAVIAVMEKQPGWGVQYSENIRNGEWEYAFFAPDDHVLVARDYTGCFGCHKPLAEQDFVYSIDALQK
jgi:hypothetical protein